VRSGSYGRKGWGITDTNQVIYLADCSTGELEEGSAPANRGIASTNIRAASRPTTINSTEPLVFMLSFLYPGPKIKNLIEANGLPQKL